MAKVKLPNSVILFRIGSHKNGSVSRSHLQRCIHIAGEIRDSYTHSICFIVREDKYAKRLIKRNGFAIYSLSDKLAAYETAILVQSRSEVIVFDGIDIDNKIPEALTKSHKQIVVIDDSSNKRLDADAVINGSFAGGKYRYAKGQRNTRYFLGPKYCVLSSEYDDFPVRPSAGEVKTVLVSFGSVDPKGFTVKVAKALKDFRLPYEFIYVIGPGFQQIDELSDALNEQKSNFYFVENLESLSPLLATADIAILSAGRACYEAARVGAPMIVVPTVKHQDDVASAFGEKTAAFPLVNSWGMPVREFNVKLVELLDLVASDKKMRDTVRMNAYRIIDGKGRQRAAKIIMSCISLGRKNLSQSQLPTTMA